MTETYTYLRHPDTDIACLADDTYMHGPAATLYTAYADKREAALAACELQSNLDKVAAWSPKGDMSCAPGHIPGSTHHPGGRVPGFKCVGNYMAVRAYTSPG